MYKKSEIDIFNKSRNSLNPIPEQVLSIIIGSLLGDAHAERRRDSAGKRGNTRIVFQQEDSNMEYLLSNWGILSTFGYTPSEKVPKLLTRIGKGDKIRRYIKFST